MRSLLLLIFSFYFYSAFGQIGGISAFDYLNLPNNAFLNSIGGKNVSLITAEPGMIQANPALLQDTLNNSASITYSPYYADINNTAIQYARTIGSSGLWAFGMNYLSYGSMERRDITGSFQGIFRANDYRFFATKSHGIGNFNIGLTLNYSASLIGEFSAHAVTVDGGAHYKHPIEEFYAGVVVRNLGGVIKRYTPESDAVIVPDAEVGASYKPEKMPLRFSLTAHSVQRWNLLYSRQPEVNSITGEETLDEPSELEKLVSHLTLGTEVLLTKSFQFRVAYNYLIRREMTNSEAGGLTGFSLGGTARIYKFYFSFSRSYYSIAGGFSTITVSTDLDNFIKRG